MDRVPGAGDGLGGKVKPGLVFTDSDELVGQALDQFGLPREYAAAMRGHGDASNAFRISNRLWTYFSPAIEISPANAPASSGSVATSQSWTPRGAAASPPRTRPSPSLMRRNCALHPAPLHDRLLTEAVCMITSLVQPVEKENGGEGELPARSLAEPVKLLVRWLARTLSAAVRRFRALH
jgi:hypothetical protein